MLGEPGLNRKRTPSSRTSNFQLSHLQPDPTPNPLRWQSITPSYRPGMLRLDQFTFSGTPFQIGHQQGRALRERIVPFVEQRVRAARVYLRERGVRDADALMALGATCLAQVKTWDPEGYSEFVATAEGAGVDPVELYTTGNMTDVRDILVLGTMTAESEGCTTAHVGRGRSADGRVLASQTWDLNPTDLDFVVAVHRRPVGQPATWSITCAGCPSLIGMNELGVAVGTTNIKCRGSRIGVPYLSLLHRMIRARTRREAIAILMSAPRAAAHTYWAADADGITDVEATADTTVVREAGDGHLCRSNHCLDADHRQREGEAATASSQKRLARADAVLGRGGQTVESLKALFADRSDGVDSVNRYPEDHQGTTTNACIIMRPATRELFACRGPADRGDWVELGFR